MRNLNKKVLVFSFTLVIIFLVSIHSLADAEIITIKESQEVLNQSFSQG